MMFVKKIVIGWMVLISLSAFSAGDDLFSDWLEQGGPLSQGRVAVGSVGNGGDQAAFEEIFRTLSAEDLRAIVGEDPTLVPFLMGGGSGGAAGLSSSLSRG